MTETISIDYKSDKNQKLAIVEAYLKERDMYNEEPSGVTYNEGKPITEYYVNSEKGIACFVIHIWGSSPDTINRNSNYSDTIYCVTLRFDELEEVGRYVFESDEDKRTTYESTYDNEGNKMASINSFHVPNIPFAFIREYEETDDYKKQFDNNINGRKFYFSKILLN